MSSLNIFLEWFKEYYYHEYPELTVEFKNEWIEKILLDNQKYITKEMVMNFDGCIKCGRCCKSQGCLDYDDETKLCTRHDNPIHDVCREYPWSGDYGIAPLLLTCRYQVSFFVNYFDKFFEQCIKGENNG